MSMIQISYISSYMGEYCQKKEKVIETMGKRRNCLERADMDVKRATTYVAPKLYSLFFYFFDDFVIDVFILCIWNVRDT